MGIPRHLRIIIQSLLVVSLLLGCSQTKIAEETNELLKYEDKNNKFTISYPKDWTVDTTRKNVNVLFNSPKESEQDVYTENITVKAFTLPEEATSPMENYRDGMIETIKKQTPGIEVLNTSDLTINELPALQILLREKRDNVDLSHQMTVVFKGNMGYVLGFTCLDGELDKYSATTDKIINSFNIIN
ncbi:PsbP protein [Brevibacillus sp. AG162]|uniref:PsbP-related protein n=1 Tax=Brevibacillus sp. AG162 TaxID=2572910 RepID=UPI0011502B01|nr:PsbP-related protein [Brevibacillus sp. AG162]TQK75005.1 PsbP protein [Brevibacillus sp. AG162]